MPNPTTTPPFVLSTAGSSRATAYNPVNKIARVGEITHVTWLDNVAITCLRSFNHRTGDWSPVTRLSEEGPDNHADPCLSVTPDGHLRLAYGPHGFLYNDPVFRHGRVAIYQSVRPNDSSEWEPLTEVGYGATYGNLLTDPQGYDHIVYRGGMRPYSTFYERRRLDGGWDRTVRLQFVDTPPSYVYPGPTLTMDRRGTLYAGFMYYVSEDIPSPGAVVIKSKDRGTTWTLLDDQPAPLPMVFDDKYAVPAEGENIYLETLAVDHEDRPMVVTVNDRPGNDCAVFSIWDQNRWRSVKLDHAANDGWRPYRGSVTVDARGRILFVCTAVDLNLPADVSPFGHPSSEVLLFTSEDQGRSFTYQRISPGDPDTPSWLPNINNTRPNLDLSAPLVIYTHGSRGTNLKDQNIHNQVHAVWIN